MTRVPRKTLVFADCGGLRLHDAQMMPHEHALSILELTRGRDIRGAVHGPIDTSGVPVVEIRLP